MCIFKMLTQLIFGLIRIAGKQIHTMVAHLDAVTSLSIDPTGLYLLSGSKYSHRYLLFIININVILGS